MTEVALCLMQHGKVKYYLCVDLIASIGHLCPILIYHEKKVRSPKSNNQNVCFQS